MMNGHVNFVVGPKPGKKIIYMLFLYPKINVYISSKENIYIPVYIPVYSILDQKQTGLENNNNNNNKKP